METLFVLDICSIICLMVLADLSRRIGEALRIPPIYKTFYAAAAIVLCASFADTVFDGMIPHLSVISNVVRTAAVVVTIPVAVRYWHWLFSEKLQNKEN